MRRVFIILFLCWSGVSFAQKYAVKTNIAYWVTTTLNLGGEMALAPRMTLILFIFGRIKKSCTGLYSPSGGTGPAVVLWDILLEYMPMEENIMVD